MTTEPPSSSKVLEIENKIQDVKLVMTDNIDKLLERGERLELLHNKTYELSDGASRFQGQAIRVKKHFWYQHKKNILYALGGLTILIVLILWISQAKKGSSKEDPSSTIP